MNSFKVANRVTVVTSLDISSINTQEKWQALDKSFVAVVSRNPDIVSSSLKNSIEM